MLPDKKVIGRYEIQRHVAHGGMGTLYLALDPVLGRPVALKVFRGDLELADSQARFQREAEAAAKLNHPNIVTIYDSGVFELQPYMVMEFIDGQTLAHVIRRHEIVPIATRLRWMEELCSAVGYAHRKNVIHRDLKPLNLMVDAHGHLKVLDFGIARMRGALASHATARIGTAGYMAPEQIRGGNIDHRSDLFSIGVVCYELVSFVEPFAAEVDVAITNRILEDEPKPLQELDPMIEPSLAELVWKALRKDPHERFQDAEAMRAAFAAVRRRIEASQSDSGVGIRLPDAVKEILPLPRATKSHAPEGEPATASTATTGREKRDALVKERTAQIQTSLQAARASLAAGQLAAARTECELVLKLDNSQPEALDLLRRVNVDLARVEAATLLSQGHEELQRGAITKALELLDRARGLTPDHPDATRLDKAVRIARAEQDVQRRRGERFRNLLQTAQVALDKGQLEEALGHAREALEIDAQSKEALALQDEAMRRIDADPAPTVGPESRTMIARTLGPEEQTGQVPTQQVPSKDAGVATRSNRTSSRKRTMILVGVGAVAAVVVAAIVWVALQPRTVTLPPAAPLPALQLVVIDALPWATVRRIVREDGTEVRLPTVAGSDDVAPDATAAVPAPVTTPLAIQLMPGTYTVTLWGPLGELQTHEVPLIVEPGKPSPEPIQIEPMTVDKYFESYLSGRPTGGARGGGE